MNTALALSTDGPLTPREWELLDLLALGMTYGAAADALRISINTVRQHVRSIYDKLDVCSKVEAVLKAQAVPRRA